MCPSQRFIQLTSYTWPRCVHVDLNSAGIGQDGQQSFSPWTWSSMAHSSTGQVFFSQNVVPLRHSHDAHWSALYVAPWKWTALPMTQCFWSPSLNSSRRSIQRAQHSPGIRICFEAGHWRTGQDFFVQVSFRPSQVHLTHGSSLSVASFVTFWPFSWHPEISREKFRISKTQKIKAWQTNSGNGKRAAIEKDQV